MGDSDDEYDRRRVRDKFRGERIEYEQRRPRGDYRERREWVDRRGRDNWSGGGGRDQNWDRKRGPYYGRQRRDSEGGDGQISPPMKRNRRDWDSSYDKGFNSGGMTSSPGVWTSGRGPMAQQHQGGDQNKQSDLGPEMKNSQSPRMMSFKSFLAAQEDNINEVESVRRYQEYKTEFRRTQLSDFFVLHKGEEWFKNKYHPVDAKNAEKEHRHCLRKRLRIYLDLLESGYMDNITLEGNKGDAIVKLLDTVAIKLEGGSTEDLNILNGKKPDPEESKQKSEPAGVVPEVVEESKANKKDQSSTEEQQGEPGQLSPSSVPLPDAPPPSEPSDDTEQAKPRKKRKDSKEPSDEMGGESASDPSDSGTETEPGPPGEDGAALETENETEEAVKPVADADATVAGEKDESQASSKTSAKDEPEDASSSGLVGSDTDSKNPIASSSTEQKLAESDEKASGDEQKKHTPEDAQDNADKQDGGQSNAEVKSNGKEDKKGRRRDWESRKGTGLGAFVDRMGGEANEDSDSESESESEEDDEEEKEVKPDQDERKKPYQGTEIRESRVDQEDITEDSRENEGEGRQLHKTLSLFMRHIPPNISKGDISAVCKRYPGYLRVALADPSPERGFYRRGWITFENVVNIKDICWNLSNIRIKDSELNPVVNRDLSKRIRPISGVTLSKKAVRFDLKFSAKLVKALDEKFALYSKEVEVEEVKIENVVEMEEDSHENDHEDKEKEKTDATDEKQQNETDDVETTKLVEKEAEFSLPNENPVIAALPQIATESAEGEEMELTGDKKTDAKETLDFTRDENLFKALDQLLLYLRIVHSIDYYNGSDYPYEDEMPNRCGILHVRGFEPEKDMPVEEVTEWQTNVQQKLGPFLEKEAEKLSDEEVQKLGKKIVDQEVENFMQANTVEQAKDKWHCPLSGKKFRAKEFVRKHILNKHGNKLEAVKMEVDFFNSYLSDPKRPQLPEVKPGSGASSYQQQPPMNHQMGWSPRGPMYGGPRGPFTPPAYGGFSGGPDMYNRGGMTYPPKPNRTGSLPRDSRKIVQYKDLDAPDDVDFF